MIPYLLRKKRFLFSFLFLSILLIVSLLNSLLFGNEIRQVKYVMDAAGNILLSPPYPPFKIFLLGSDRYGYDLLQMMIQGAKYTIGLTLFITGLRILLSLLISYFLSTIKPFFYKALCSLFEPFSAMPQVLICYFILFSVLWMPPEGFHHPFWLRAAFEVFILVMAALPSLSIHLSNELRTTMEKPFITAAKTMGGSKFHIFTKHLIPVLYEKWLLLFGQQFLQVLLLMAHLGVLELFFGGSVVQYGPFSGPPRSSSYEWSGLIGASLSYLRIHQWIALVPLAFYVLTALSVAFINSSVKEMFQERNNKSFGEKSSANKRGVDTPIS